MRDLINLKGLKKSPNRKHNTIYNKAHRIMESGFQTEELSEAEILSIASKYPELEVRVAIGDNVLVRSKESNWLVRDEGRFITLYHKSLVNRRGRIKENYHVQDVFYDLDFVFASIVSHDDHSIRGRVRGSNDLKSLIDGHKRSS